MNNSELSDLLIDSLALWGVSGRTIVGNENVRVLTDIGHDIAIRRPGAAARSWEVEILKWPADDSPPARRIRNCASVVSLLRTTRALLIANPEEVRLSSTTARPSAGEII
jgi:hypothetical protein